MPELILGLDVGTTSARALVVDPTGRVHGKAQTRLESQHPAPGRVEQDPNEVWQQLQAVVAQALAAGGLAAADLAAVGIATQRSSVVVWERSTGRPLAPMILWSDRRGTARAGELQQAGHFVMPLAAAAKLEAALDLVERGRQRAAAGEIAWGGLDSYLVYRLSGGALHVTDYSNAWSTGYLDLSTRRNWNASLLAHQGLPVELFPTLCDTYGRLGSTTRASLAAELPLCAIVADQQSGMFAHGAWQAGDWKATYGTSATLMVSTGKAPVLTPGLTPMLQAAHGDEVWFAVEGMVVSAGALLDWLVRGLALYPDVHALTRAAASVPDSDGVALLPALHGLGAPHHDAPRRAAIVGLSGSSTHAHVAHAAFESIAFRLREIAQSAAAIEGIVLPDVLPVDGGLASNGFLLQTQADLLGRPVERLPQLEATALGACLAAALGAGLASQGDFAPLLRPTSRFEPKFDPTEAKDRFEQWRADVALGEDSGSS